jgi:hypothetical protein
VLYGIRVHRQVETIDKAVSRDRREGDIGGIFDSYIATSRRGKIPISNRDKEGRGTDFERYDYQTQHIV